MDSNGLTITYGGDYEPCKRKPKPHVSPSRLCLGRIHDVLQPLQGHLVRG